MFLCECITWFLTLLSYDKCRLFCCSAAVNGLGPPVTSASASSKTTAAAASVGPVPVSLQHQLTSSSSSLSSSYCHHCQSHYPSASDAICSTSPSGALQSSAASSALRLCQFHRSHHHHHFPHHRTTPLKRSTVDDNDDRLSPRCRVIAASATCRPYELSEDLRSKQVEMLGRKYGGQTTASRAARVIQHAYRQYRLSRSFARMRLEVNAASSSGATGGERRLSRRFPPEFGVDSLLMQRGPGGGGFAAGLVATGEQPASCVFGHDVRIESSSSLPPRMSRDADAGVQSGAGSTQTHSGRVSTRVFVSKTNSVSVTTTCRERRVVVEHRSLSQQSCGTAALQPSARGFPRIDGAPPDRWEAIAERRSSYTFDAATTEPRATSSPLSSAVAGASSSSSLSNSVKDAAVDRSQSNDATTQQTLSSPERVVVDVDEILSGNIMTAPSHGATFHQLSLSDSSYGDIDVSGSGRRLTGDEEDIEGTIDIDDDDDGDEGGYPEVYGRDVDVLCGTSPGHPMTHVYSSLRLCSNKLHTQSSTSSTSSPPIAAAADQQQADPMASCDGDPFPVSAEDSPVWKRKETGSGERLHAPSSYCRVVLRNRIPADIADSASGSDVSRCTSFAGSETGSNSSGGGPGFGISAGDSSSSYAQCSPPISGGSVDNLASDLDSAAAMAKHVTVRHAPKVSDKERKRTYRIGLNLFNKLVLYVNDVI